MASRNSSTAMASARFDGPKPMPTSGLRRREQRRDQLRVADDLPHGEVERVLQVRARAHLAAIKIGAAADTRLRVLDRAPEFLDPALEFLDRRGGGRG